MKILMLITRLNIGGPAVQVISLSADMQNPPYQTILACGQIGESEGDMSYLAEKHGIKPLHIPFLGREVSLLKDLRALIHLIKLINKLKPDILHTHTAKAGALGRMAAFIVNVFRTGRRKIRCVHTFHGHIFNNYFNGFKIVVFQSIEKILSKCTDRIIAISPSQKKDLCHRYSIASENKISVIPLGFDLSKFIDPLDLKKDIFKKQFPHLSENSFLVGIVGRLTAVKNPRMIIMVAKYLEAMGRGHDFIFIFVGDGELKTELMREVAEAGLEKRILFMGWRKDVGIIYHGLDAVLLSSLNEGTPVSLIEAMAAGKIVISTDVGGVRDLMGMLTKNVDTGFDIMENGILVNSQDVNAMAFALLYAKDEKRAFLSKAQDMSQRTKKYYSNERILADMIKLYEGL